MVAGALKWEALQLICCAGVCGYGKVDVVMLPAAVVTVPLLEAGLRIRIRIQSGQWIRIRIRNPDPDQRGQK